MDYLQEYSAEALFEIVLRSHNMGIIGIADYQQRLRDVRELLPTLSPTRDDIAYILGDHADEEPADYQEEENTEIVDLKVYAGASRARAPFSKRDGPMLEFVVRNVRGMSVWEFHKHDADPNPSIPHGHENGNPSPKLNPYSGRVYDNHGGEMAGRRLLRKTRVQLWNDAGFREFALSSICWYESAHPHFEWRVPHPHRLPRKQRR